MEFALKSCMPAFNKLLTVKWQAQLECGCAIEKAKPGIPSYVLRLFASCAPYIMRYKGVQHSTIFSVSQVFCFMTRFTHTASAILYQITTK